jgi:hypothetical protein
MVLQGQHEESDAAQETTGVAELLVEMVAAGTTTVQLR